MLPNFLIIGAAKSGTTSLYRYLRDHPQVFMAHSKELKFFASRTRWGFGPGWYAWQCSDADGAVAIGEASPSYTRYPQRRGVPERVAQVLPDARLVYLIRHPIERMRSHYLHRILREGGGRRLMGPCSATRAISTPAVTRCRSSSIWSGSPARSSW